MKKIEFIEKTVCNEFVNLAYWKGEETHNLLLNIPDLLDYLYKTDCIQDYDLPPYNWGTDVLLEGVDDPKGPEEDQKEYSEWVSLTCYMVECFNDEDALRLIMWHERNILSDKILDSYFPNLRSNLSNLNIRHA